MGKAGSTKVQIERERKWLLGAANAVGLQVDDSSGEFIDTATGLPWNPLKNDGDAQQLVAALGLRVDDYSGSIWVQHPKIKPVNCRNEVDPARGARSAIVLAAYDIGKQHSPAK